MSHKSIPTGSDCLDNLLEGGIAPDEITLIYGEAETGKTTLAMQCAAYCAFQGLKTLYVDCDGTFATERLMDIAQLRFNEVAEQIILMKPKTFEEQAAVVDRLEDYIDEKFGLIVVDTLNSLYRAEVAEVASKSKAQFNLSRELNRQIAVLSQIAKTRHIPVIVTSQVKALINEPFVSVAPVATRVVQFWANTTIALKPVDLSPQTIQGSVQKDRNTKEATFYLRIGPTGIHDAE